MFAAYDFSQGVREVLVLAREEAQRLRHEYVGTEHILLALLRSTDATSVEMRRLLAVDADTMRTSVDGIIKRGTSSALLNDLPYTSRGKKAIELAMHAASEFGHACVDTDHLLLGLVRERNGIGGQILIANGVHETAAWNAMMSSRATTPRDPGNTMRSSGVPKAPVKRIIIEVQHADGTITRRESDSTRDAIMFLLRA